MEKLSVRSDIAPFVVMDVMQAAAEREKSGGKVYHLEVGQPGTSAPDKVIGMASSALTNDKLGYTVALGLPALREEISNHYRHYYDLEVPSENIIITPGSSGGILLAFLSGFDKGDKIAVPVPGYPCYRNIILSLDLVPVDIFVGPETDYLINESHLESIKDDIKGTIVSSPSNPTGTMYKPEVLKRLANYCDDNNIVLISDEIYHGITFEEKAASALSFSSNAIIINSFSKYFSMTGWRIGWMIVPETWIRRIERLIQNIFISTSTISQMGAVGAFSDYGGLDKNVDDYRNKRNVLYQALKKCGIEKMTYPSGAFYIYADVSQLTNDSVEFCKRMLLETGVAITPGVDFDPIKGHQFIRFSFASDMATIMDASEILIDWFSRR